MEHPRDARFTEPLYTVGEAARFLRVPPSTMATWTGGYTRRRPEGTPTKAEPVVTAFGRNLADRNLPRIPFVGLAEAMVVAAFRRAGVSLQHIRRALQVLEQQLGIEHVLASQRLYTDGSIVLFDYAQHHMDELGGLTVVVTQQRVFSDVVREYLDRITYAPDGWAQNLVLPLTQRPLIKVDPTKAFGQPFFIRGSARMQDVIDRFAAGDPLAEVAEDFGVPPDEVEDVLRAIVRPAA